MPNFDGGHYFFACLLPVEHSPHVSHEHELRAAIAALPTGFPYGDPPPGVDGHQPPSPFAKCLRTHFARMVVIGDTAFNGRDRSDAISVAFKSSPDPSIPGIADQLSCAYLLLVLDFDAKTGTREEAAAYLADLWRLAGPDLADVFSHIRGFRTGMSADAVAKLMLSCQIDTTMPFNDYWSTTPPFENVPAWRLVAPGLLALAAVVGAVALVATAATGGVPIWAWIVGALLGSATGLFAVYRTVLGMARNPLPTAPHSDLVSILKALHLQRHFIDVALAAQGDGPQQLHDRFGAFLAAHAPSKPEPRQRPGVI